MAKYLVCAGDSFPLPDTSPTALKKQLLTAFDSGSALAVNLLGGDQVVLNTKILPYAFVVDLGNQPADATLGLPADTAEAASKASMKSGTTGVGPTGI